MASSMKFSLLLFFACSLLLQGTLGEEDMTCESLGTEQCAFAVDTEGNRCLLTEDDTATEVSYKCIDSNIQAKGVFGYTERDHCVEACGVDRTMIGLPNPDSLKKLQFIVRICSAECYDNCQNIIDLYSHIAAGEGIDLQSLCKTGKMTQHRSMSEVLSGSPAPAPAPGGGAARPVGEMASSLWEAATDFFESAANAPSAADAVDSALNAVASSPAAAGYEDDYSASS